jgi:DNA-binding MarR family transcriptional regulator
VKVFSTLRALRAYEREHLPFLLTLEDFDVIREIGYHQESGTPLTLKLLFLQNIGSVATIQRRVRRLKRLGVVHQRRSDADRRNVELTVDPEVLNAYKRMSSLLKRCA